jgi:hypothetical protein
MRRDRPHFAISRHALPHGGFLFARSPLSEIARVRVRLDHVARFIVNANGIVSSAAMLRVRLR